MTRLNNQKIDFVVLWVDGNDPEWLKEKNKHLHLGGDTGENRFRDCDNMQYLFRGIEKFAPWVNKVFFITWGHVPTWLDISNPKIKVVKHEEFIPKKYLPTFNSNVIELNLHRIEELSDNFVLFNDDLFILKPTKEEDFFIDNLPSDTYCEYIQLANSYNDTHYFMKANIFALINKNFNKLEIIEKNKDKFLDPKNGEFNEYTLHNMKFQKKFVGFWNFHVSQPYLKQTLKTIWDKEEEALDLACQNKFRASTDLGIVLCRYWQFMEGNFIPKENDSHYFRILDDNSETTDAIINQKYQVICINDVYDNIDFEKAKNEINEALNFILPKKSSFEK